LPQKRGICGVRENREGKLYALTYGKAISEAIDPIEKKPFYHFLPGTKSLSIATLGCNFRCDNCQNWQISQGSKGEAVIDGFDLPPEKVIEDAQKEDCPSIAYTYTEPTIFFEYAFDCMKLAKKEGIKNVFVTNGYMTKEMLKMAKGYLDAANVDLKFFDDKMYLSNCGGHLAPILDNLKTMRKLGIWVEITTLSIPTLSDSKEMFEKIAQFIKNELGSEVPWHLSRFSADISYKLNNLKDTSLNTLEMAYEIGKKAGLKYVYLGNVPGHQGENTFCPKCGTKVIERIGYQIKRFDRNGRCPKCVYKLELILK
jgi:pyruvate formate lyase activating enzyme